MTSPSTNPWHLPPGSIVLVDGVSYVAIDASHAAEFHGPFTACDCRPFCGLPPCTGCDEDHGGHDMGGGRHLCRDCHLEHVCSRMAPRVIALDEHEDREHKE